MFSRLTAALIAVLIAIFTGLAWLAFHYYGQSVEKDKTITTVWESLSFSLLPEVMSSTVTFKRSRFGGKKLETSRMCTDVHMLRQTRSRTIFPMVPLRLIQFTSTLWDISALLKLLDQ
ncbi:TPA: hypothetical protein U5D49_003726 [Yersinia enterocolitica]|nr:hypothetical protein [Yersinia enterocolitica]